MCKVEVITRNDHRFGSKFVVQVTFREPFEHLFEIAEHAARFEHMIDANALAERVRIAVKENGWKSPSFVFDNEWWHYSSSAYTGRMSADGKRAPFVAHATKSALRAEATLA
jgi:hypothetical protein